jgi:uncharacterized protein DUF4145
LELAGLILEYLRVLSWPVVALIFLYIFKSHIENLFARLKSATIPGGISIDLSEEIVVAKTLSAKIPISTPPEGKEDVPLISQSKINLRMISLGLDPSPSGLNSDRYRSLASEDPNLALAGIRIEMEILARNLAKGFDVNIENSRSAGIVFRKLNEEGAISSEQFRLVNQILKIANAAVHGTRITENDANDLIDVAEILSKQYINWLSWGFDS